LWFVEDELRIIEIVVFLNVVVLATRMKKLAIVGARTIAVSGSIGRKTTKTKETNPAHQMKKRCEYRFKIINPSRGRPARVEKPNPAARISRIMKSRRKTDGT
jgi:hypothetical protein